MITLTPNRIAAMALAFLLVLLGAAGGLEISQAKPAGATDAAVVLLAPKCDAEHGTWIVTGSITNQWTSPLTIQFDHNTGSPIGFDRIGPGVTRPISFTQQPNTTFVWSASGWFAVKADDGTSQVPAHVSGGPWTITTGDTCVPPTTIVPNTTTTACPPGAHPDGPVSPCAWDTTTTTSVVASSTTIVNPTTTVVGQTTTTNPCDDDPKPGEPGFDACGDCWTSPQICAEFQHPSTSIPAGPFVTLAVTGPSATGVAPYAAIAVALGALIILALRIDAARRAKRDSESDSLV